MPKISVIFPVYNTARFLAECLDSLEAQSAADFEVLLVDDGSTDSSLELCREQACRDRRFSVVSKKNGGVSSARNAGLECARGEYICFVDSDDFVHADYLLVLMRTLESADADLAVIPYYYGDAGNFRAAECLDGVWDLAQFRSMEREFANNIYLYSPCNKLYRSKIIRERGLCFDSSFKIGEDGMFNLAYLRAARRVASVNQPLYYYVLRKNSAMRSETAGFEQQTKALVGEVLDFFLDGSALCDRPFVCLYLFKQWVYVLSHQAATISDTKARRAAKKRIYDDAFYRASLVGARNFSSVMNAAALLMKWHVFPTFLLKQG